METFVLGFIQKYFQQTSKTLPHNARLVNTLEQRGAEWDSHENRSVSLHSDTVLLFFWTGP